MTYEIYLYERSGNVSPDVFDIVRPFIQAIDSGRIFGITENTAIAEPEHTYPVALHFSVSAFHSSLQN
ncbi:hypothetical protein [Prosthecochloris sp.]|uniref:hypothetical protein n=1 Tax=Prosthecochloris sp. TaxID=290513 RepID=UPI00258062EF|nr:hypothetical protein [Prosthecochloris sp.]